MATGLLIRDFFKEYRELRYSGSGAIGFSDIEKNAYRLSLTLEITHLDAPRYSNLKTLPENSHFGYCTLFRGSTVTETIPIKYPKFRVFDIINQGIWEHHQATESQQLGASVTQLTIEENGRNLLDLLGEGVYSAIRLFVLLGASGGGVDPGEEWVLEAFPSGEQPETYSEFNKAYRGFPVASPFPDLAKFKADVPCSFLWRLESWYLVNPAIYVVDSPTDSGDETEGESEYPEPEPGDGDGDGSEFPDSDFPDSDRDPKDFTGGQSLPIPPGATITVTVRHNSYAFGCGQAPYTTDHEIGYFGSTDYSVDYLGSVNGCDGAQTPGGIRLNIPGAASIEVAPLAEQQFAFPEVVGFVVNYP